MNAQTPDGEIRIKFTGNGWKHLKANMKGDPVKAALTPQIPSIIHEGEYFNVPLYKKHSPIVNFHSYRKKVDTAEGPRMVIVDVAQQSPRHQPQYFPYGLTREGGALASRTSRTARKNPRLCTV